MFRLKVLKRLLVFLLVLGVAQVGLLALPSAASAQELGDFWFLAEGSTAWGFNTWINIANPADDLVVVEVTYMTTTGRNVVRMVNLPPESQARLNPYEDLGPADFSTEVRCVDRADNVAVDRTMIWFQPVAGDNPPPADATASVGANTPETTWYLPEGSSAWGFDTWVLVQNPNGGPATVDLTFMIEGSAARTFRQTVGATSRKNFNMFDFVGAKDASIMVSSNVPVVVERSMFRDNKNEGHESLGATEKAIKYYLAEGSTAWGFTTFVLVQNPNDEAANVHLTFQTPQGIVDGPTELMPGKSRKTFSLNGILNKGTLINGTDVSTVISSDKEIVAERAMYWRDNSMKEAAHDSIGMTRAHDSFYFAGGYGIFGVVWETYTLVQNPNPTEVTVRLTYLSQDGLKPPKTIEAKISGNSRKNFRMQDTIGNLNGASTVVQCQTPTMKIMAETAQYAGYYTTPTSNILNKSAGTDTIGASWDNPL